MNFLGLSEKFFVFVSDDFFLLSDDFLVFFFGLS